jgi:hypothetical protein
MKFTASRIALSRAIASAKTATGASGLDVVVFDVTGGVVTVSARKTESSTIGVVATVDGDGLDDGRAVLTSRNTQHLVKTDLGATVTVVGEGERLTVRGNYSASLWVARETVQAAIVPGDSELFRVAGTVFAAALARVLPSVNGSVLPVLGCVRVRIASGELQLVGTDQFTMAITAVRAISGQDGDVILPGRVAKVLSKVKTGEVVATQRGDVTVISVDGLIVDFTTPLEYPRIDRVHDAAVKVQDASVTVDSRALRAAFSRYGPRDVVHVRSDDVVLALGASSEALTASNVHIIDGYRVFDRWMNADLVRTALAALPAGPVMFATTNGGQSPTGREIVKPVIVTSSADPATLVVLMPAGPGRHEGRGA